MDVEKFQEAVQSAADIFETFKLRFGQNETRSACYIDEQFVKLPFEIIDFTGRENPEADADRWIDDRFRLPFLINEAAVPFEEFLLQLSDGEYWFCGKYHPFIADGYGFVVFINYLAGKYKTLIEEQEPAFAAASYVFEIEKGAVYFNSTTGEHGKKAEILVRKILSYTYEHATLCQVRGLCAAGQITSSLLYYWT